MVYLIGGSSHTGKTLLSQRMLEKYGCPYLSIDHLKMGLIRSGNTALRPDSPDEALTAYLWPIVREIIKTCIENKQNLIIEGCYIPFDYAKDFEEEYLMEIRYKCLVFSREYIENRMDDILAHESAIESRLPYGGISKEELLVENERNLMLCRQYGLDHVLIEGEYKVEI